MPRTFAVGDIHGNYLGLKQALERSPFNPEADTLISLGDLVDGHSEPVKCINLLLGLPHTVFIRGNHDQWCYEWLNGGTAQSLWLSQGGMATFNDYKMQTLSLQRTHLEYFFKKQVPFYELDNNLFVHGGYTPGKPIENQFSHNLMWDRDLWRKAGTHGQDAEGYNHCFIGHTTVTRESKVPVTRQNITNLDTGGGWEGRVSIMDVASKEYWQSDDTLTLYPDFKGR